MLFGIIGITVIALAGCARTPRASEVTHDQSQINIGDSSGWNNRWRELAYFQAVEDQETTYRWNVLAYFRTVSDQRERELQDELAAAEAEQERQRYVSVTPVYTAPSINLSPTNGIATHYGESYNGRNMGCGGIYDSHNAAIIAVSPSQYSQYPCGTPITVCGSNGCIQGTRTDACPGCGYNHVDLSESGLAMVCGSADVGTCDVQVR